MGADETMDLFPTRPKRRIEPRAPLADRMRPTDFDEMIGQEELVGPGTALRSMVESGEMPSVILWGPPGAGKTTLAWLLAAAKDTRIEALSAVVSGVKEIREAVETARRTTLRTLLFIDEIHRLNRAQQDVLLPHVEAGTVTLIGATTENPSFTVNAPLLSRCRVLTLKRLEADAVGSVVARAVVDTERGLGQSGLVLPDESRRAIVDFADGDARKALGLLEAAASIHLRSGERSEPLPPETVREAAGKKLLLYDRDREEHYNVISALIKSLRASDPDAALYYLARMLESGEDPLFIARRLLIFASEDVGNADPWALTLATSTHQAVERLGMPEARITLAQATTYLACAIKSNAAYAALNEAQALVQRTGNLPVPMHLRNAPTRLMKEQGYAEGYQYPHDAEGHFVPDANLPEALGEVDLYRPSEQGAEAALAARLRDWRERRKRGG
jgi:putative ATPase